MDVTIQLILKMEFEGAYAQTNWILGIHPLL